MRAVGWIIVVMAAVAVFSTQNAQPVPVVLLFWNVQAPLALLIAAALLVGVLAGLLIHPGRSLPPERPHPADDLPPSGNSSS